MVSTYPVGGVGGFSEGFSSGLGQGMGIIQSVRQDKRAQQMQDAQLQQMQHASMIQDHEDARAQTTADQTTEQYNWNKDNMRPLTLQQAQLAVQDYQTNIKLHGAQYAEAVLRNQWLPKQFEDQHDLTQQQIASSRSADARGNISLADQLKNSAVSRTVATNQDNRASTMQNVQIAASVLPIYTQMLANGITPPPSMTGIVQSSPFGMSQQAELAKASQAFPTILQQASKGDFSFMQQGDTREAAFSLARPSAMRYANQRGLDPNSARVTNMWHGQDGLMWMQFTAYDPKTKQYHTYNQGVNPNGLVEQMDQSARNGMALAAHPAFAQMQQALPGYTAALGGNAVRQQAGEAWDKQMEANQKVIQAGRASDPAVQQAQHWINQHGDRQQFVENMVAGQYRAQNGRGDANPMDFNRVASVVSKNTGVTDPSETMTKANAALSAMDRLGKVPIKQVPHVHDYIVSMMKQTGSNWDDPAFRTQVMYGIASQPNLRAEMGKALAGGSGAARPPVGGNYRPVPNAAQIGGQIFGAHNITSGERSANDPLTKANPNSWHTTGAAFDMRPVKGMTFDQAAQQIRDHGYHLIEAIDEVNHPSKWATGPHWHFVLGT